MAFGDSSRLVEDHQVYVPRGLQGGGVLEQDALSRRIAGAHYDRQGSRQSEGAGTGDHQHGHHDRDGERRTPAGKEPCRTAHRSDEEHRRDEYSCDLVCHACDGGLGALCTFDHRYYLMQKGVLAGLFRPDAEAAGAVDSCSVYRVSGFLHHGDALAGEHGLIDIGVAFRDDPVHRDAFARPHQDRIADRYLRYRDPGFLPVADDGGLLRFLLQQFADRIVGLDLAHGLQVLPDGDEGDDHGRGIEGKMHHVVHVGFGFVDRNHHTQKVKTVAESDTCSEGHESVHVRTSAQECGYPADVESPSRPQDRDAQHHLNDGVGDVVVVVFEGDGYVGEHAHHRVDREGDGEDHRYGEIDLPFPGFPAVSFGGISLDDRVAGLDDGLDDLLTGGSLIIIGYCGSVVAEIGHAVGDAGELLGERLDLQRTGGA